MRVAMLGTRGVPAQYGGFETAVEEIGTRLAARGHEVVVYSRNPGQSINQYRGMQVVNLPAVRQRFAETLSHTAISSAHAAIKDRPDVALVLNAGNAPLLRPLRASGIPAAVHLDGLESRREKWRGAGAKYYRWAERAAIKAADEVIVDSQVIQDYVRRTYGRQSTFIAYGARVFDPGSDRISELGLVSRDYHLVVARLEPENHVLDAVHAYKVSEETRPLVVVGSAPYSEWYIEKIRSAAAGIERIRLIGSIYDHELLDQLYANSRTYIHGHSVGGTNPSLLRAMGVGAPVLAYDCPFNREVTADQAFFWADAEALTEIFDEIAGGEDHLVATDIEDRLAEFSAAGKTRVTERYQWDQVAEAYEDLLVRLARSKKVARSA